MAAAEAHAEIHASTGMGNTHECTCTGMLAMDTAQEEGRDGDCCLQSYSGVSFLVFCFFSTWYFFACESLDYRGS